MDKIRFKPIHWIKFRERGMGSAVKEGGLKRLSPAGPDKEAELFAFVTTSFLSVLVGPTEIVELGFL